VQVHHLDRRLHLLLGREVVELELVLAIRELARLEHFHQLVLAHAFETLELLLELVRHVAVENRSHLEVHVQLQLRWLLHVHVQVQPRHQVDVLGAAHGLARLGVELAALAEALLLDHVLLEHAQDVPALVEHAPLVALLALQLDRHLQVVGHPLVVLDQLPPLVRLRLDHLDQRVVLDLSAQEHLLQLRLDAEGGQDALPQVLVLLDRDRELCLLLVHARDPHLLEEDGLREAEVDEVGPDRLVPELLALQLLRLLRLLWMPEFLA